MYIKRSSLRSSLPILKKRDPAHRTNEENGGKEQHQQQFTTNDTGKHGNANGCPLLGNTVSEKISLTPLFFIRFTKKTIWEIF